jgi:hypothetical protein
VWTQDSAKNIDDDDIFDAEEYNKKSKGTPYAA